MATFDRELGLEQVNREEPAQALHALAHGLQNLRDAAPQPLRELSRRTHVSASALSRYFTGQALPPWEVVETLCQLSGVDPSELRRLWDRANAARLRARWSLPVDPPPPGRAGDETVDAPVAGGDGGAGDGVDAEAGDTEPGHGGIGHGGIGDGDSGVGNPAAGQGRRPRRRLVRQWRAVAAASCGIGLVAVGVLADRALGGPAAYTSTPSAGRSHATEGAGPNAIRQPAASSDPQPSAGLPSPVPSSPSASPRPGVPSSRPTARPVLPAPSGSTDPSPKPSASASPPELRSGAIVALVSRGSSSPSTVPYVIDIVNWTTDDGGPTHLWTWRDDGDYRTQLWSAERVTGGYWRFRDQFSGMCLAGGADQGAAVVQRTCADTDSAQQWTISKTNQLQSAAGGRCLEIKDARLVQDAALQMAKCKDEWSQEWLTTQRQSPNLG